MITLLSPADTNLAYRTMTRARARGDNDGARVLAVTLRDSIVNGGVIPDGPMGRVGCDIIAALADPCAHCGELLTMAGGLWVCTARNDVSHDAEFPRWDGR